MNQRSRPALPKPVKQPKSAPTPLTASEWGAKRRAADNAEARFQSRVEELATFLGWWHFHVVNPRPQTAGLPDLVLLRERLVFMELKATSLLTGRTGKVSPAQERVIEMLRAAGQEVYVFRDDSADWEEIKRVLSKGGKVQAR